MQFNLKLSWSSDMLCLAALISSHLIEWIPYFRLTEINVVKMQV